MIRFEILLPLFCNDVRPSNAASLLRLTTSWWVFLVRQARTRLSSEASGCIKARRSIFEAQTCHKLGKPQMMQPLAGRCRRAAESSQYFGTLWSISSDQALMPPLTLFKYLKPCCRRNSSAFIERLPLLQ